MACWLVQACMMVLSGLQVDDEPHHFTPEAIFTILQFTQIAFYFKAFGS